MHGLTKVVALAWLFQNVLLLSAGKLAMKIVQEPASYGFLGNNLGLDDREEHLVAQTKPMNFSGPLHLKRLVGKCYNLTLDMYRYTFCPFQNITQVEISSRWNAYHGVLGVWQEWKIVNNSFSALVMSKGDSCGNIDRQVEVYLHCGQVEMLLNVTEPNKCRYIASFSTPLVCHRDALLVYPRLSASQRDLWDQLETDLHNEILTDRGYEFELRKVFEAAGFMQVATEKVESTMQGNLLMEFNTTKLAGDDTDVFANLKLCSKAYKDLKAEIELMKQEIEMLKAQNQFRSSAVSPRDKLPSAATV